MDIVPFKSEHAEFILSQQLNAQELYLKPEHRQYAQYLKRVGMSFTALINNKPIAAGGIYLLWDGVAEGWVMATKMVGDIGGLWLEILKKNLIYLLKLLK